MMWEKVAIDRETPFISNFMKSCKLQSACAASFMNLLPWNFAQTICKSMHSFKMLNSNAQRSFDYCFSSLFLLSAATLCCKTLLSNCCNSLHLLTAATLCCEHCCNILLYNTITAHLWNYAVNTTVTYCCTTLLQHTYETRFAPARIFVPFSRS